MAIDLFGHGVSHLPSGTYSDGPDRKRGPAKCRGVTGVCSSNPLNPHDHSCCCDPCRHVHTDLCSGDTVHCCKCVPRSICAVFTPDSGTTTCYERSFNAVADTELGAVGRSTYRYVLGSGETLLSVGGSESGLCTWRLYNSTLGIDEEYEIDHSGPIHCQAPPEFSISGVNIPYYPVSGSPIDCYGTITFEEASFAKVPFKYRWDDVEEFDSVSCGACTEVCNVVCVRRGNDSESTYTRTDFIRQSGVWNANDTSGEYFSVVESGGACYVYIDNMDSPFIDDMILIDPEECSLGMNLSVSDTGTGDWLKMSCNPCSCWDYVCGTCRCVCKQLCVVGVDSGVLVPQFTISWDYDNVRWGDDDFNIYPTNDINGNCKAMVTGYESGVSIPNSCGNQISFIVQESTETQLENGAASYLYATCKNCEAGGCGTGSCLEFCEEVPSILYAEICPTAWDEMLGCPEAILCFECITIPLIQTFVSTFENPAGEYRWQGCGVISCRSCNSSTRYNKMICLDLGCDGIGTMTGPCGDSFTFTLPCGPGEIWDLELGPFPCSGGDPCCDEAGFLVRITE